jgi:outer membrane lipoprotein-sorting protein
VLTTLAVGLSFAAKPGKSGWMKIRIAFFAILLALGYPVAQAHAVPPAATLTQQDQYDLKRVADYLNTMQRMQARILQLNPDGSVVGGVLKIARPGKLRLDYDAPINSLLLADGSFVHYWDAPLKETSSVPQSGSPAALILDAQINFTKGMTITKVARGNGTLKISMYKTDDPGNGVLTLVLGDAPLALKQWYVDDAQGSTTQVTLQNIDTAPQFAADTFIYSPPRR